ncbi:MAG: hypothetical protein GY723_22325, partial [bacterium]|nr:hypothetical protein [bacterium]
VPRVDELGIDLGGINQPIVEVPVATLTGWNLRTVSSPKTTIAISAG